MLDRLKKWWNKKGIVADAPAKTRGYQPYHHMMFQRPRDLPPFTFDIIRAMLLDPAVRLGIAMRAAPIFGVEIAYKEGDKWCPGLRAKRADVGAYVLRQYQRIWSHGLESILTAQVWGWSAGEVTFRSTSEGMVEIDSLLGRHAGDCRALIRSGEKVGTRVLRVTDVPGGHVDLDFPKSWFHSHRPEAGTHYGTSICLGAYSPFADKWFSGGALDVRRLFMHKDAYGGVDLAYPDGVTIINGEEVPNRDLALQIGEQVVAGGVTTRPSFYDNNGNELWKLDRATVPGNPEHILQYPKDLDTEIYHGLEIPDDVIESETGAWAGKRIPLAAFYAGLDSWVNSIFADLKVQVIDQLLLINFDGDREFAITHKPLAEQAMEQQGNATQPGQIPPGRQQPRLPFQGGGDNSPAGAATNDPYRMAIDPEEAVGRSVLNASHLVRAARRILKQRLSLGPHDCSSAQFNLPFDLASQVVSMASRIHPDDLAAGGIETDPHITVKYGLHTDDPEEVRGAIASEAPIAVTFGDTSIFSSDQHDVVKIEIESDGLRALNRKLANNLSHTDTHPTYKPHLTIAYVKPGLGERIASTLCDFKGKVEVFDRLTFSDRNGSRHSILLTGQATRFSNA